MAITTFKRIEKKYVISEAQKQSLLPLLHEHMELDPYCLNDTTYRIQNIYFDTENNDLIIKSISKPIYKEKMRLRKYTNDERIFLEIKKKVAGVVGKRRIKLTPEEADDFILRGIKPVKHKPLNKQIVDEMSFFLSRYKVKPMVYISYDRLGFFDKNDPELRLTFDSNIRSKRNNLEWDKNDYEHALLPEDKYVIEVKGVKNFPLWLVNALSALKIYPGSFSKYGTEYKLNHK